MSVKPRFAAPTRPAADVLAEQESASAAGRARAVRIVAARSTGVEDCRELLDMLGLHHAAGLPGPAPDEYVEPEGR